MDFYAYHSIFDYLLGDNKSEILSLSVSFGGNKEIYDNIRSATLSTINKFSMVYDEGISALQSSDYPEEFRNTAHYQFIQKKINEIGISLKYSDLRTFGKYMKSKNKSAWKVNTEDFLKMIYIS